MSNLRRNGLLRWVPSYLRRRGQMTPGQKKAFREHWPVYGIPFRHGEFVSREVHFPAPGPLFLEIGFGMGENLVHLAERHPTANLLGIEVHKPGIGAALKRISEEGIDRIRLMRGDARLILSDHLDKTFLFDRIGLLFPDPWPGEENAHRRIVQPDFFELIEPRLKPGGILHLATDVDEYRDHIGAVIAGRPGWTRLETFDLADFRGPTKYERRGLDLGHPIHDLLFRRFNT